MYMRYISKLIKEALSLKPVDQDRDVQRQISEEPRTR